jgi:YYY domain-containing protein
MVAFLCWYVIITLLGWLTFPLVYALLPALADRGYSLARAAGLLLWGYAFWLLNSLGLLQNNVGSILFAALVVAGLSASTSFIQHTSFAARRSEISEWLRSNLRLIISIEVLFLLAFAFLALVRAGNPELDNAEKPMELMFINAILRSPSFPPHDAWLSGFAISYYYFGYVMAAMLAMLTGLTGSVAHNLMTALIFGLAAIGSYGILYNLLAARSSSAQGMDRSSQTADRKSLTKDDSAGDRASAFLAPLFLLLVSNLEGFLEVLHSAGMFWSGPRNFWTWLGIKDLNEAPTQPLGLIPDRFWWWWRASRVISDFDLAGNFREVIDEFPFFSFLHADLHPHVLAIPFNLLAVAVALNLVLGGWRGSISLFGLKLRIHKAGFFAAALILGGLAFLNTWDILIAAALILFAYVLFRAHEDGWSWSRLEDFFTLGLPLGALAIVLYLPFYFGFSSQAGGILPNLSNPTRGAQLWVMFAPLFLPLLAYLLYLWRGRRWTGNWLFSLVAVVGIVILLWAVSWLIGWIAFIRDPAFAQQYLSSQGMPDVARFFSASMWRRFAYIGGLLTLLAILIPALAFLVRRAQVSEGDPDFDPEHAVLNARSPVASFVFMLILLAGFMVLAPEFVFLRDQFSSRLNTIFKFYYQAWLLWSIAAAFAVAVLLRGLHKIWCTLFTAGLLVLLSMALTYPALSLANKTNDFKPALGWTLDDFTRIQRNNPDEAAAILWLKAAPDGVVVEAVGGSYTGFARISEYTGLPSVLGWPGHESQWRGTYEPQGTRQDDIAQLYSTPNWDTARAILEKYSIQYVYVGDLERATYAVQEEKFQKNLRQVFQRGNVAIYEVP